MSKNVFEELWEKMGYKDFITQLIMFEKKVDEAVADEIYTEYMESDTVNTIFDLEQFCEKRGL